MRALVEQLRAEGFELSVADGKLVVKPAGKLTALHRQIIKSNKQIIIAELLTPVNKSDSEQPYLVKLLLEGQLSEVDRQAQEDERQDLIETRRIDLECKRLLKEKQQVQVGGKRQPLTSKRGQFIRVTDYIFVS